ncbi:MAG: glycosyltransferase family 4 protein [Thermoplasmata archaeon]
MRVLMVTPFGRYVVGGISNFVHNLSRVLSERYSVVCRTIAQIGSNAKDVETVNVSLLRYMLKALVLARKFRPQIIHAHSDWRSLVVAVVLKILHSHSRAYFTFHTDYVSPPRGFKRWVFEFLLSKCDGLTFSSRYLRNRMIAQFELPSKRVVSYPGVAQAKADERDIEAFKSRFDLEDHYPILAFLGPLVHERKVEGVGILIKAVGVLVERGWKPVLLVIGDGPHKQLLEDLTNNLNLTHVVVFTGVVQKSEIPLSLCDIYTHISLQESLSLSVLEAMIQAKPVIASAVGGIPEIVKDGRTGLLVRPDPSEIASKIMELANDKERMRAIGQDSFQLASERFSWERTARVVFNLYVAGLLPETEEVAGP